MGKKKRAEEQQSFKLPITLNPKIEPLLAQLVSTGLFGNTPPEVVRTLFLEKLREVLDERSDKKPD